MYFEKIDKARKTLGLGEEATLREIKEAFRRLSKKYHPDRYSSKDKEEYHRRMSEINRAYETLLDYLSRFKVSFRKEVVEKYNPARGMKRFFKDWLGT